MSVDPSAAGPQPPPASSAPPPAERDDRLDLLRGLFVLKMIVGHLGWSRFEAHFPLGWVTAAEGFFCVSGATLGLVARRFEETGRRAVLLRRLRLRAPWLLLLYLTLVALAIGFQLAPTFTPQRLDRRFPGVPGWQRLISFDHDLALNVLPRYAVLLFVAPGVLWLLRRQRGALVALGLSAGLWAANLATGKRLLLPLVEQSRADFGTASWQLLFFGGVMMAWSYPPRVSRPGEDVRWRTRLLVLSGLLVALFVTWEALTPGNANATRGVLRPWVDRGTLAPLRMLNFLIDAVFLWLAVDRWRTALARWFGWLLLPLGRNALAAFVLHLPLLWLAASIHSFDGRPNLRLGLAVATAAGISLLVRWRWIRRVLMPV